jgi:phthiocerol/phenolphthiocerol synthesis type-I polyketide synthase C
VTQTARRDPIAIVGIGCRLPGGIADPAGLWRALLDGIDAITEVPADRFDARALFREGPPAPGHIGSVRGGFLDGIDRFDPGFFGMAPREAERLDPQQRLLLETAWEALEDAGVVTRELEGSRAGVYVGLWLNDFEARLFADPDVDFHMTTGSGRYAASGRLSYALGWQGPSVTVDTACSSSLVAVHLACRSIWSGESPIALAGGANIILQPHITIAYSQSGMMAADGRCKFGDARANGYVRSEGAAMIVLKPLARALADGDRVYALIRGSAVNNDGRSGDYMATPAQGGQEQMLRLAYADAGVEPGRVAYVEAHGTGTGAGDPVEVGALGAVLTEGREPGRRCLVGSIKTNFGHTEGAAGVVGLIKAALVLRNREVPASLHFQEPNPSIPWADLPLAVAGERATLPAGVEPLVAGVSSFGIAGTNAHVVLEEEAGRKEERGKRKEREEAVADRASACGAMLVPVSARSAEALREAAGRWAERLEREDAPALEDVAFTAARRRDHHPHRLAVVAGTRAELVERLRAAMDAAPDAKGGSGRVPGIVFVFPGQGSQWTGMGRELIADEPVFRAALEECDAAMRPFVEWSLLEQLALDEGDPRWLLDRIDVVQPTLVSLDIALARLWRSWGIEPAAVVGHSMGEVAAACVAGALDLPDAMRVICLRSRLLRRISGRGAMAAVELPIDEAAAALAGVEDRVAVAASNSPRSTILAGEPDALRSVLDALERRDVFCRLVNVDVASHSPQVDPLRADLLDALQGIEPRAPSVPFASTVLGRTVSGAELTPEYWVRNLRQPVLFSDAVQRLVEEGHTAFVEISPHPVLLPAVEQTLRHAGGEGLAIGSLRRNEPERAAMLASLGALYAAGADVAWARVTPRGRLVPLPTYPWQRERHWFERGTRRTARSGGADAHPIFGAASRSADGHLSWEGELSTGAAPLLAGHRVRGQPVLPAAACLEMALAAAGDGPATLEDFVFEHALRVPGEDADAVAVQVACTPDTAQSSTVSFFSRDTGADGWDRFAKGRIVRHADAGGSVAAPAAPPIGAGADPAAGFYDDLAARGLDYGDGFRAVAAIRASDGEAVARLRLPGAARAGAGRFRVHPALLDGCLQLLLATLSNDDADGTYLPISVRRMRARGLPEPDAELQARAVRRLGAEGLEGDVVLLDEQGQVVLEIEGAAFRHLPDAAEPLGETLLGLMWEPQPLAAPAAPAADGTWLLVGEASELADGVVRRLEAAGASCLRAHPGADFREINRGAWEFDPARPEQVDRLLASQAHGHLRAVVLLSGGGARPRTELSAPDLDDAQSAGSLAALHLAQALLRAGRDGIPPLRIVTRGAQAVRDGDRVPGVAHAPLWGMAGVLRNEHPELGCRWVDLGPKLDDADRLVAELLADGSEERVAYRGGERLVARLVRRPTPTPPPAEPRRLAAPYGVVSTGPGLLDNLRPQPLARRAPARGEAEIEVRAVGLNFMNVMSALGTYPGYPNGLGPLGIECAGVVSAVGEGAEGITVGDEVVAFAFHCLATHAIADARLVAPKPAGLHWEQAATVPIAFLTASYALEHLGRVAPGERVLVHSATGGVGLAALQIARAAGAEVIATAGTEEKRALLRSMGVEHVFDSRSLGFADEILAATGDGVDIVLNSLAGEAISKGLAVLRPFGRFLELGKRDVHDDLRLGLDPFRKQLTYSAIDLDAAARERPELVGRILGSVVERVAGGELEPLPCEVFPVSRVADAFHRMAAARHVGKVVVVPEPEVEVDAAPPALRGDASYLVTGGLGALGLEVARWMAGQGARHLVLVGRGAPSDAARAAVAELERGGAEVRVERADVADGDAMAALLARIDGEMPPLRGVVHAAGLLADATAERMDAALLAEAMAPKVRGAWNLHRLTAGRPLDLFVLFSSVSSLIGIPGQANYAAANAFLDALAAHRHAVGLPALSIGWGPWGEVGLAARQANRGRRLDRRGLRSLGRDEGIALLDALVRQPGAPHVVAARLDVARWCESHPAAAASPLFARLREPVPAADAPGRPEPGPRETVLAAAPGRERRNALESHLRVRVAQILRLVPDRLALDQPLKSLGMDSLMSLELRNRIEADLGLSISATAVWNYPTVSLLAGHLAERLAPAAAAAAAGTDPERATADRDREAPAGDAPFVELEREQVESLLDRELAAVEDLLRGS